MPWTAPPLHASANSSSSVNGITGTAPTAAFPLVAGRLPITGWTWCSSRPRRPTSLPSVPASLTATAVSSTQISLHRVPAPMCRSHRLRRPPWRRQGGYLAVGQLHGLGAGPEHEIQLSGRGSGRRRQRIRGSTAASARRSPRPIARRRPLPTGLTATSVTATQVGLSWKASTDNIGVAGYHVTRNGTSLATTATTSFVDGRGVTVTTSYSYTISAYDEARVTPVARAGFSTSPHPPAPAAPGGANPKSPWASLEACGWPGRPIPAST